MTNINKTIVQDSKFKMRFYKKIETSTSGCMEWTASKYPDGYGMVNVGGTPRRAHRVSLVMEGFNLLDTDCVCHKCDNPVCVNPQHLFIGSKKDNSQDMLKKDRHYSHGKTKTHCKNGHEFTDENTQLFNGGKFRYCKECKRVKSLESYYKKKGLINAE